MSAEGARNAADGTDGAASEAVDAVVVGTGMRGLVAAYLLSQLGYSAVLVDRSRSVGGVDGSFLTPGGVRFDYGLHVLDFMSSEVATRLFTHVVGGEVHRIVLERGIVLRGEIMPYAPRPEEMPEKLRSMLPPGELVDDVGDDPPTRERLARCYGRAFTDFVFDEVLPSYRSENRHRGFGVEEWKLLGNVYPWMFPRARRTGKTSDESRAFHDRLREGIPQEILYPKQGGFGGFARGFLRHLDPDRIEVITGASDLALEIEPGTHTVRHVTAGGRRFRARHYFWGSSWPGLCAVLGLPCPHTPADRVLIGSFVLDRPAVCDYHELLVGDSRYEINRVSFPARFRESDDALMQVEYAVPIAEDWPVDADSWREIWLEATRRLGLLGGEHRVVEFDFKSFDMHFNSYGMEGEALVDADPAQLRPDSNIHPLTPSLANLNLNRHVPQNLELVASVLAASRGEG